MTDFIVQDGDCKEISVDIEDFRGAVTVILAIDNFMDYANVGLVPTEARRIAIALLEAADDVEARLNER